jgi:hypothetical protein
MEPSQGGSVLTHRALGYTTLVVSLFLSAASASAQAVVSPQATFERGWIDVNFGIAMAAEDTFSMKADGFLFDEPASIGAAYSLPRGASFDFGGGFMFNPVVGVGVSFTGTAHEDIAVLSAHIPHPTIANAYADDIAPTDQVLQRIESGVNLQAMIVAAQTPRFRFRVFGGPTYFRVQQDAVTAIRYDQAFLFLLPVNAIEITEFDHRRIEGTGWGFHGGADASFFFTRVVGVGGIARFSRGSVGLENTLDTSIGGDSVVNVKAGGFQVGGGLRLKF